MQKQQGVEARPEAGNRAERVRGLGVRLETKKRGEIGARGPKPEEGWGRAKKSRD